ncbi:uncharacterized protein N7496_005749 [Penicillium cataractarum]|uniref:Uncharacterized protein n=1 Tax=Penicillium cataractarum TaxID=2100454 RepID=A0A9W9VG71_9EURO|nr:uncharacterized protein N7496_005749 [Penicillium cataractarum]KAJ5378340.1 hypothetical protein N7496_005749 [Penicillium cataractarum]
MIFEQIAPDSEHQFLLCNSSGPEVHFTPNQHPQLGLLEGPISLEDPTIDPAILDDNGSRDFEQTQQTAITPAAAVTSRNDPAEQARPPVRDTHCYSRQQTPRKPVKASRGPSFIFGLFAPLFCQQKESHVIW